MDKLPNWKDKKKWEEQRAKRGYSDYDTYGIYHWFINIIPDMLEYKAKHFESIPGFVELEYCKKHGIKDFNELEKVNQKKLSDWCSNYWKKTLQKIAFLFREADEHTCSYKNQYQEEHNKAFREYLDKYGLFGSKVKDNPYINYDKNGRKLIRINHQYNMVNLEEYKDIEQKFRDEYLKIEAYQDKCRKKAFSLLRKYFYDL